MVYGICLRENCITVDLSGTCVEGSEHNSTIREIVRVLRESVEQTGVEHVVLNCRALEYKGGDSIGWIWVAMHKDGLNCSVRAVGETKELLSELMDIGLRVPITD